MSRLGKIILIAAGIVFAIALNTAVLGGIVVYRACTGGTAVVSIHEKQANGARLWIPVPVGLVTTALRLTPRHELPALDPEARRFLPAAQAAIRALEGAPDGVLVEVQDHGEHVVIAKRGGQFVIDVDNRDERVQVSVPAGSLRSLLDVAATLPVRSDVWRSSGLPGVPGAPEVPAPPARPAAPAPLEAGGDEV
jgi:hypothetical protein